MPKSEDRNLSLDILPTVSFGNFVRLTVISASLVFAGESFGATSLPQKKPRPVLKPRPKKKDAAVVPNPQSELLLTVQRMRAWIEESSQIDFDVLCRFEEVGKSHQTTGKSYTTAVDLLKNALSHAEKQLQQEALPDKTFQELKIVVDHCSKLLSKLRLTRDLRDEGEMIEPSELAKILQAKDPLQLNAFLGRCRMQALLLYVQLEAYSPEIEKRGKKGL
jgi:hypothetical protein